MNFTIGQFGRFEYYAIRKIGKELVKQPFTIYGTITDIDKKRLFIADSQDGEVCYMPEISRITKFEPK
jgi:hypothetical protein